MPFDNIATSFTVHTVITQRVRYVVAVFEFWKTVFVTNVKVTYSVSIPTTFNPMIFPSIETDAL